MKRASLCLWLLFIFSKSFAQSIIYKDVTAISKIEFDMHLPAGRLVCESIRAKGNHRVVIKTPKKTIVLKDDGEMQQYEYGCDMTHPPLTLIHELEANTEEYYLINRQTASIDTLIGNPVFYPHSMTVACLDGATPDSKRRIQIGQIIGGRFKTNFLFTLKVAGQLDYVYWFDKHTLFLNSNNEKFYKLTF